MVLGGTEHERLLALVDLIHEELYPVVLALPDLDDAVEVVLGVAPALFDLALDDLVIRRVDVVIQGRGDLADLEGRQVAVVDAFLQGVDVDRLAEVGVGVGIVGAPGCGGQAQLHGGLEVLHDAAPVALVIGATPVALIDDDEIEEIRRIVPEVGRRVALGVTPGHEGLEDGEEDVAVLRHPALLADGFRVDTHQRILGEGREVIEGLVGEDVPVGQEQDSRLTARLP